MMELESEGKGLFDAQNYLMDKIYCLTWNIGILKYFTWQNSQISVFNDLFFGLQFGRHTDAGADGPGVEVLLDAGQLLHPRHPGGEGGVLAHHARLHQPHQVQDRVEREVGVANTAHSQHVHSGYNTRASNECSR